MSRKKAWISVSLIVLVFIGTLWLRASRDYIIINFGIRVLHTIETVRMFVIFCTVIYFLINLFLLVRTKLALIAESNKEAERKILAEKKLKAALESNPSKRISFAIASYLDKKPTTEFFREHLHSLKQHVLLVDKRVNMILDMAAEEFGENTLSYNQFVQPVQHLYQHLVDSGMEAVQQLEMFDALLYTDKINNSTSLTTRREYEEVMHRYKDLISSTLRIFEQAVLKLDKLLVEVSSLGFDNIKEAVETLSQLDTVIKNTKLWKE